MIHMVETCVKRRQIHSDISTNCRVYILLQCTLHFLFISHSTTLFCTSNLHFLNDRNRERR
ncbi:hypothetical protein Mgra_00004045 [Meloidogyne graminicola]|uniref:Uncharacterized protein n=1 Tax=Meloidogyne graminicola TaxID=189291 RepID=A0A8S9ZTE3_9BILA|nr:hypothetical protein Mgra_00004045 [Meloidogyne graminicola]